MCSFASQVYDAKFRVSNINWTSYFLWHLDIFHFIRHAFKLCSSAVEKQFMKTVLPSLQFYMHKTDLNDHE